MKTITNLLDYRFNYDYAVNHRLEISNKALEINGEPYTIQYLFQMDLLNFTLYMAVFIGYRKLIQQFIKHQIGKFTFLLMKNQSMMPSM